MVEDYLDENIEISALANILNPALTGVVVTAHIDDTGTVILSTYRQSTLEAGTYAKLSCLLTASSLIDCYVIDRISEGYRFTIIYTIQSLHQGLIMQIVTKTSDLLPIISLQSIYPSLNWAEREV
jgi:NADH:ubiquinone oxidoreductase subunit C